LFYRDKVQIYISRYFLWVYKWVYYMIYTLYSFNTKLYFHTFSLHVKLILEGNGFITDAICNDRAWLLTFRSKLMFNHSLAYNMYRLLPSSNTLVMKFNTFNISHCNYFERLYCTNLGSQLLHWYRTMEIIFLTLFWIVNMNYTIILHIK
jgi:hypothetical protein